MSIDFVKQPFYPSPDAIIYPERIPYRGCIPNGLHDGKLIEIRGTIPYGASVFEVNLLTGLDPSSDRPLHISVRFSGHVVVRNSLQQGMWGAEERYGQFPFHSGRPFTIMLSVESTCYRIAVDNQHCWEFVHRILPLSRVTSLHIDGSVQIDKIEFIDRMVPGYPSTTCVPIPGIMPGIGMPGGCIIPPPEQQINVWPQPARISSNLAPVYNPTIPYAYPIYGGLKPGMMVYISGRPSASAYKFTLNFQAGTSPYPPPDIAFHFDVRFYNHTIVRNSRTNNVWEREETLISHFPFQPAVNFDMIIRIESNRFMVALNGQHFIEFRHRLLPLARFDTLYIENDIVVSSIRFA